MIFIEQLHIKEAWRNLKVSNIPLDQITLLVGDQGCGKSTLLKEIQNQSMGVSPSVDFLDFKLSSIAQTVGASCFYFDSESMNPRVAPIDDYYNPDYTAKGIGPGGALASRFMSHGEALKRFTVDMLVPKKLVNNSIILLDEPESGLSVKNQFLLSKRIQNASKSKRAAVQFIIATHCVPLIAKIGRVYDLENGVWTKSIEYLNKFK